MTPQEFISKIAPIAVQLRKEGSTIFPSVRIAQSALETGWKIPEWNNMVGFKVGSRAANRFWNGAYVNKGTWEVYDGKRQDVVAAFRAYDTLEDCYRDQDELFKITRYDQVRAATTPIDQAVALYRCGYATDPAYSTKIISIISQYGLEQYDRIKKDPEPWEFEFAAARDWVIEQGISDGTRPKDMVTREELWTMLYRAKGE